MEPLLNPPTEGDDRIVSELESEAVLSQDFAEVSDPPDETDSITSDADGTESDLSADPDHENLPPPETDPAMTFEDLNLNRAVLDAIDARRVHAPDADSGSRRFRRRSRART